MPAYFRLQGLVTANVGDTAQGTESAVDIGRYSRLSLGIQRSQAGGAGSVLVLQTAATLDASAFIDLSPPVDLNATGGLVQEVSGLLRFVRWRSAVVDSAAKFLIDVVAREV